VDPFTFAVYLVKGPLPAARVGEAIQRAVSASDPDQPVSRVRPVESDMRESIATERFTVLVASLFAGLALALAAVGTFGVMSHVVNGRTREIGVRMALGATRANIVSLMLRQAGTAVIIALAAGLGAAVALGASMQTLLYEVKPRDPSTMALATLVLVATAFVASYVPIRRMLAQNPLASLRND
jgi:ABC-type antimicrobial peptide transport system permease subunit